MTLVTLSWICNIPMIVWRERWKSVGTRSGWRRRTTCETH